MPNGVSYGSKYAAGQGYCSRKCAAEADAKELAEREAKKAAKEAKKAAKQAAREEEYESGGGSSSSDSDELPSGCGKIFLGVVIIFVVICLIGALFVKNENLNDPAVVMEKWHEHLEKRRAAFAEGLTEEGVEARGYKNYTWEEWQALKQKGQNSSKSSASEKTDDVQAIKKAWEIHLSKMAAARQKYGVEKANEMGLKNYTFDEFRQYYKKLNAKSPEQNQKEKDPEAELKRLNARLAELEGERKTGEQQSTVAPKVETPSPTTTAAVVPVKPVAVPEKPATRREAVVSAKPVAMPEKPVRRRGAEAPAKPAAVSTSPAASKTAAPTRSATLATTASGASANGIKSATGGQQNGTSQKASKDSKAIRIIVQGKGKTKEAALRYAFCQAVWKTVGTWVDSKTRIEENRDKVVAIVATVTENDISKFEVLDTWQQDGTTFVKVRVSVSKKKIAPKLEKVFPDVFANE